jgi:hypothetical protein
VRRDFSKKSSYAYFPILADITSLGAHAIGNLFDLAVVVFRHEHFALS